MNHLVTMKQILRALEPSLEAEYGVKIVGLFGSYIRNEQLDESDLDVLIEINRPAKLSLLDLVELEQSLSNILAVKVDLVIKENLKTRIGQRILNEVEPL